MKGDKSDRYLQHWGNILLGQAPPQNYFGLHGVICLLKRFTSFYLPHAAVNTSRSFFYTRNTLKWHYRQPRTPCWLHLFHLHLSVKTPTFQVSPPKPRVAAKDSATRASITTAPANALGVQPWPQGTAASTPARLPVPVCPVPPRCAPSSPGAGSGGARPGRGGIAAAAPAAEARWGAAGLMRGREGGCEGGGRGSDPRVLPQLSPARCEGKGLRRSRPGAASPLRRALLGLGCRRVPGVPGTGPRGLKMILTG